MECQYQGYDIKCINRSLLLSFCLFVNDTMYLCQQKCVDSSQKTVKAKGKCNMRIIQKKFITVLIS